LASALGEGFFLGAVEALPDGRLVVIGAERRTGRVVIARFTAAARPMRTSPAAEFGVSTWVWARCRRTPSLRSTWPSLGTVP